MNDIGNFKHRVQSALGWAIGTRFLGQLTNWALTLATVRFLHPEEYGLMAMTMAITGFVQSFSYAGFLEAIVQRRDIDEAELRSVFALILLANGACLTALCILAYPAAYFYGEPRLVALIQVSSLSFIAVAFQIIPRAMLDKRFDIKAVSQIELISHVTSGVLVLALAISGAGVWALVTGVLFSSLFRVVAFNYMAPFFRAPRFSFREIATLLRAAWLRTGDHLLWYFYSTADILIVGKVLGTEILGIYTIARNFAALPVEKLAQVVKPVAFPAFVLVQNDNASALVYLQKAMRLLAFVTFPVFFGVSAIAPWITGVILGPKWSDAAVPLAILALAMAIRPVGMLISPFLISIGQFSASFKNTALASIVFPTFFLIGSYWGIIGVCIASLIAYPLHVLSLIRRIALVTDTPILSLISPLLPPLTGSLIMYIGVSAISTALSGYTDQIDILLLLTISGVAFYLGYTLILMRNMLAEFLSLARR